MVDGKPMRKCEHGTFPRTSVCKKCTAARRAMPKPEKAELPVPPKGCKTSIEIERWFTELAEASLASAVRIEAAYNMPKPKPPKPPPKPTKQGRGKKSAPAPAEEPATATAIIGRDFHDEAAIANHRDRAIKAMRAATELATRREDDWIVDRRDELMAASERGESN